MLKVLKFGGSSMADAHQLEKVRSIVEADPARRVVVVSAAGKRFKDDHKITDLLYLCHAHLQYGVSCDGIFDMVRSRYLEIRDELGLSTPLEAEFDALRAKMDKGISADELVSRGWVVRTEVEGDRRCQLLQLTAQGREFLLDILPRQRAWQRELWEPFSSEERQQLVGLLRKVLQIIPE
jgi:hypothetical protein